MGLTSHSTGSSILKDVFEYGKNTNDERLIALAGNPNTGKSTLFNALTGLKQHTGNWPGKTVTHAQGTYTHNDLVYTLIDLPGTYSLLANSAEEEVARDFICFGHPKVTVVVTDATCLERNLNLVLQILEITSQVIICVNLIDEAQKKGIEVDLTALSNFLKVPVIGTNARDGIGLTDLKDVIEEIIEHPIQPSNDPLFRYSEQLEQVIDAIQLELTSIEQLDLPLRWLSLRLIDGSEGIRDNLKKLYNVDLTTMNNISDKIEVGRQLLLQSTNDIKDTIVNTLVNQAEGLHNATVTYRKVKHNAFDRKMDHILTSKLFGIPIMLSLLGVIFWLTISGANIPSEFLAKGLFFIEEKLYALFNWFNAPSWVTGLFVSGMYRTLAWVVSVMLPPMAIFFPMFTLLEDLGYLPRIAFNLDHFFKKACAHGKQALTMCMGFGCNAAGIIGCRIIDSPRERLIAILTNNFVPCNGRFPTLIALSTIFIAGLNGAFTSIKATLAVLCAILLGVFLTLLISKLLSKTILKGMPSTFTLELPPYRKPQIGKVIVRSIFDRTLFVLGRAVMVAAPAGLLIWVMANITISDISILTYMANFLDPFAKTIGLDGYILTAFILGLPANEIVLPILIMSYMSTGAMLELDSLSALRDLFIENGWTWLTAICTMIFTLNHFPCGTTLWTIKKETGSLKWTFLSFLLPTLVGFLLCFIVAQSVNLLGLI